MSTPDSPELSIEAIFEHAVAAAKSGDKEKARALFERVTRARPEIGAAWQWRAFVAASPQDRVICLRKALDLDPGNVKVRQGLRQALLQVAIASAKAGARHEARRLFRDVTELDPASEIAWLWLASLASAAAEKLRFTERVLEINPDNERARAWKASLTAAGPDNGSRRAATEPPAVLVIDDSPTVRSLVSRTLKRKGCDVAMAADPSAALESLERAIPDLIFLDIELPEMDGFDLCQRIRARPQTREVPIVMLSGKDGPFDKFRGKMVGAQSYITKPFSSKDLVDALEEFGHRG